MPASRTKSNAASNEDKDIAFLIQAINTNSLAGQKIKAAFEVKFPGQKITSAKPRVGSSRKAHYDFIVVLSDGTEKRVEHKGSKSRRGDTKDESDAPWRAGVQFFNGGCEKYSICCEYAQVWYDVYIGSEELKREFALLAPTPTFDEWWQKDCRPQGDPGTLFGKELKEKVRATRGERGSLLEKRAAVNSRLQLGPDVLGRLKAEVGSLINSVLAEKELWITIHGVLESNEFDVAWYPPYRINIVKVIPEVTDKDIWFIFEGDDGTTCEGILRWGKGAGFSNLRIDAR
jgi:hypothetical protein